MRSFKGFAFIFLFVLAAVIFFALVEIITVGEAVIIQIVTTIWLDVNRLTYDYYTDKLKDERK